MALDRIGTYLDEDEVDEQVSSLKKSPFGTSGADDEIEKGLGIENGTFKWNEVEQNGDNKDKDGQNERADKKAKNASPTDDAVQDPSDETERASIAASDASEHRFELRDINIKFPERRLTVVTGPTASGKTALLVGTHSGLSRCYANSDITRWHC